MSKRRLWLVAVGAAVPAVVLAVWLRAGFGGQFAVRAADDLGLLMFAVFGTSCCLRAAGRTGGRHRVTWLAMGAGLGAWSLGEVVWCYYELWRRLPQAPFPSPADAAYLIFPVAVATALISFPGGRVEQSRPRLVLDGMIVSGSLFIVSWVAVLGSVYQAGAASRFALGVSLAYPLADLVLITMTVMLLARADTVQRLTLTLLSAGIVLMSFSDSVFAYLTATDPYQTGNLIDLGWVVAFILFGLAALSSTPEPAANSLTAPIPARTRLWLPYLPLVLAAAVGADQALPLLRSAPGPAVTLLVVIVVLARQFLTVADNQRLLQAVAHQAFHDPLTGLANRALFTDRLERAVQLQRRDLRPLAVVFVDLNGFKQVNDQLGHAAGDELLVRVAERLTGCLRSSDTIARVGGDEFAILIEDDTDAAILATHRILDAFTPPFLVETHPLNVRASIGLATAPGHAADVCAETLLKHADQAMYTAKRSPTGGIHLSALHTHPDPQTSQNHTSSDLGGIRLPE